MKKRILILGMVLSLLAVMVIPSVAFAATTEVGGTYADATIEVVAPSAIDLGTFAYGDNEDQSTTNGSVTVTANSDNPTGWTVDAAEETNSVGYEGYMVDVPGTETVKLANKLQISKDGTTYADADTGIPYSGVGLTGELPFYVNQVIAGTETAGDYTITITFTGGITF